jgi:hypothetical protein
MKMTRRNQARFVRELCDSIRHSVIELIGSGAIPDTWNGAELRVLLAGKFAESASMVPDLLDKRTARRRQFDNDVLTRNL